MNELLRDQYLEYDLELEDRRETIMAIRRILAEANKGGLRPRWAAVAACRGQTEVMYPEKGVSLGPARALCSTCQVTEQYRAWADTVETAGVGLYGFLGGESARERSQQRKAQRRFSAP